MKLVSHIDDYDLSHRYGIYMEAKGKDKDYNNAFRGAYLELRYARLYSEHEQCVTHLERSIAGLETDDDFDYDFIINGKKVDPKSTMKGNTRLVLKEGKPRPDVTYVAFEALDYVPDRSGPPTTMEFRFLNWCRGENGLWEPAKGMGGMVTPKEERSYEELEDWLG